ncbi:MAG TPA: hypothetical protein VGJ51_07335, partial [Candidatus Angelobacter sp.]
LPLRGIRSGSAQHDKIKKLFLQTETLPKNQDRLTGGISSGAHNLISCHRRKSAAKALLCASVSPW